VQRRPHRWAFADCDRFELVLGPSILVELDELKITGGRRIVADDATHARR
jgi:hypothetical protein